MATAHSTKACGKCKHIKPITDYGTINGKPRSYCKPCHTEDQRARRNKDPEWHREQEKLRRLQNLELYKACERRADANRRSKEGYLEKRRQVSRDHAMRKHREQARVSVCADCQAEFCWLYGEYIWSMTRCDVCAEKHEPVRLRMKAAAYRAKKRNTQVEPIDPFKVLERDKWRCHLCGVKTPKSKRGTHDDRAPELEHIVSLADGGTHTWGNVACSCRKCNIEKGAASHGQLGFDIS